MNPYYQDDLVTLYHGDCLQITDWLAADVLVTDPPYGVANESNMNRNRRNTKRGEPIAGDSNTETRDAALTLWRERPAIVFGKWTAARPLGTKMRLIWDKTPCGFTGDLSLPWGAAEEEIYILGSGFTGRREANILRCQTLHQADSDRPQHPTPKPVPLMEALLTKCPPGVVADPFSGSGTTLIAAKLQGRHAIGVEIEERYCEITANRLAQDVMHFEDAS